MNIRKFFGRRTSSTQKNEKKGGAKSGYRKNHFVFIKRIFCNIICCCRSEGPLNPDSVRVQPDFSDSRVEPTATHPQCVQVPQVDSSSTTNYIQTETSTTPVPQPEAFSGMSLRFSEIYSRHMMGYKQGFPIFDPEPTSRISANKARAGIRLGDVGLVTQAGTFDFLFNVCDKRGDVNPTLLPENFRTIWSDHASLEKYIPPQTSLFSDGVTRTGQSDNVTSYGCSGESGAVLELPEGATLLRAQNEPSFRNLAAVHADSWYRYAAAHAGIAPNGSLYLVTAIIKSNGWGAAVFDRHSDPEDFLRFSVGETVTEKSTQPRYHWESSGVASCRVGPTANSKELDNSLFLRGFRIMIQWEEITEATVGTNRDIPGHAGSSGVTLTLPFKSAFTLKKEGLDTEVQTLHPSEILCSALLKCAPQAKVALAHDDVWCKAVPDKSAPAYSRIKMDDLLDHISQSYEVKVQHGCAFLDRR